MSINYNDVCKCGHTKLVHTINLRSCNICSCNSFYTQTFINPASYTIDMKKIPSINEIAEERRIVAEMIYKHLENWQTFKVAQHPEYKNTDYKVGGLFNLLESALEDKTIMATMELFKFIHKQTNT